MNYVIIGCSAAGINAIEAIRSRDRKSRITVISDEERPLYSRCLISYLIAGTIPRDKIWIRPDSFFKENSVNAILGTRVTGIDAKNQRVVLENKKKIDYDALLIATGSSPKIGKLKGSGLAGFYPLRTLAHAEKIESYLGYVKKAAVLGGGLIGLRAAYALKNRGKDLTVFVRSPYVLSRIVDEEAGLMMQEHLKAKGINIVNGRSAIELKGKDKVEAVVFEDGSAYECQLTIIGKGVQPNIDIAREAHIKTGYGVMTDRYLMTSEKNIYAAGDVAESEDIASGTTNINAIWPVACEQGRVAGLNMTGARLEYDSNMAMNSIEFFGLPVISIGVTSPDGDGFSVYSRKDDRRRVYKKIVTKGERVVGALFVNSIERIGLVGALIKSRVDARSIKDLLMEDYIDYGRIIKIIKAHPGNFREKEFAESIASLGSINVKKSETEEPCQD